MIVVDVETTGTDSEKHSLISIGAIEFENPNNEFYGECQIWKGAHIDNRALGVNGFSREDITDPTKQTIEMLMRGFLAFVASCQDKTLAGHNVAFDVAFLQKSARLSGVEWSLAHRTIDTHTLVYFDMVREGREIPLKNEHSDITSDKVFEYVGLRVQRETHNALEDAKLTAESIHRLFYKKPLMAEFSKQPLPAHLINSR